MSINETLRTEVLSLVNTYDFPEDLLTNFLTPQNYEEPNDNDDPFLQRQNNAQQIIKQIIAPHNKRNLLRHLTELAQLEYGTRRIAPRHRDHVVHALLSFILGIYINDKFLIEIFNSPVNPFEWKIAGLFHDIGYPVQIAQQKILKPFFTKFNEIKRNLNVNTPDIFFELSPRGLGNLTNGVNSFDLIQERINTWGLRINASEEYERKVASGDICHGMLSALSVLYIIDLLYQKYNPDRVYEKIIREGTNCDQTIFETNVVSACSAIFVHNLENRCFTEAKINPLRSPLAFLLRLSDCLQEWERPSFNNPDGFRATLFDIEINSRQLIFHVATEEIRDEITRNLFSSLDITADNLVVRLSDLSFQK